MRRVLIVDDSALVRASIQGALERYGFGFGHADTGAAALERAAAQRWDLIFLDVVMPVMDGPTALRALRERGDATPVVLVTSVSTAAVVGAAVKLGGVQYVAKPFTPELIATLAVRQLRIDPAALPPPPRVLLQHVDPTLPARLARLLPAHVAIDATTTAAESLDRVAEASYAAVLVQAADGLDEARAIGGVLRPAAPGAARFALDPTGRADAPWQPDEDLDGVLPLPLDAATVKGFLYPLAVRPLVHVEGEVVRAAAFDGPPAHAAAYRALLVRGLLERAAGLADVEVDLRDATLADAELVALVGEVCAALRAAGAAPVFRVPPAVHARVAAALAGTLLVAA